jgi:hypothetical protein
VIYGRNDVVLVQSNRARVQVDRVRQDLDQNKLVCFVWVL